MATVKITIAGLCLFALDTKPGAVCMYVLMPERGAKRRVHRGRGRAKVAEKHYPVLLYRQKNALPGENCGGHSEDMCCIDLNGWAVSIKENTAGGITPVSQADLPSVAMVSGNDALAMVGREYIGFGKPKPSALAARVVLRSGTGVPSPVKGDRAEWTNQCSGQSPTKPFNGPIATKIDWTISGLPDAITLELRSLTDETKTRAVALQRAPGETDLQLVVVNVPKKDIPPADPRGTQHLKKETPADHYEGFYALFPGSRPVIPCLAKDIDTPDVPAESFTSTCKARHLHRGARQPPAVLSERCPETQTCAGGTSLVAPA
jgi:hypothetical protein